jgi:Copine
LNESGKDALLIIKAVTLQEYIHVIEPLKPKFIDYLRSGWTLNLSIGIDYTASNGKQDDPDSLHFMGPSNQYESVITTLGEIIEQYDDDKLLPVFGFGGVPSYMGISTVNHCFPLTGNP